MQSETLREVEDKLDFSGNYEDILLLKESPRGKIYSATRAGKRFLLKAAADDGAKAVEALKREYEVSMSVVNPYVVYVFTYESGSPVGPCIVMEYVDGRTLREWLDERPSLHWRQRLFSQLLEAVGYLHSKGLLHNDLSPDNILVTRTGNSVKIIDFGFADDDVHYLGRERGSTRGYASPELLAGEPTDARSDIYSIGALMHDFFGTRYFTVSGRACRRNPASRYPSVPAMQKAWNRVRRFPIYTAVFILGLCLAFFACDFVMLKKHTEQQQLIRIQKENELDSLKRQLEEQQGVEMRKKSRTDSIKRRVDDFYLTELVPAERKMKRAGTFEEALAIWNRCLEKYGLFCQKTANECPEECYSEVVNYMTRKYNTEFPTPPQRDKY